MESKEGREGMRKTRVDQEGAPNMEKTGFVDQKAAARFERVRTVVLRERRRFAAQGSVVAGWRVYGGRRLGPYFRLAYREGGRQRSVYLGRCMELARRVRELLEGLKRPRRDRLLFARLIAQVRASLRCLKIERKQRLAALGIQLKGLEFRGVRRAMGNGAGAGTQLSFGPRRL